MRRKAQVTHAYHPGWISGSGIPFLSLDADARRDVRHPARIRADADAQSDKGPDARDGREDVAERPGAAQAPAPRHRVREADVAEEVEDAARADAAAHHRPRAGVVHEHANRREVVVEVLAFVLPFLLARDGRAAPETGSGDDDGAHEDGAQNGRTHPISRGPRWLPPFQVSARVAFD